MELFEKEVSENQPISPAKWLEGATRVNALSGEIDNTIAHLQAELNTIQAEYIKSDFPANKALVLAKSRIDYRRLLELQALKKRIENFMSNARRRANINEL
jgi:hypothetical protein